MYSSYDYLSETSTVISHIQKVILSYDCTLAQTAKISGVSFGCLKHLLYGTGEAHTSGERIVYDQGAAPRYDRVIRLLAGRYIPHDVFLADGQLRDDLMGELIVLCVTPIQQASRRKLENRTLNTRELRFLPSWKRMRAVAGGKIPQLDYIVRFIKAGTISPDDLAPSTMEANSDAAMKCTLPAGLTEENTRDFFAALMGVFALK